MVSMTLFAFVVVGSTASALLFAKIASSYENQTDFRHDLRVGFDQLSFDVRNAEGISSRSATGFTLTIEGSSVIYSFNNSTNLLTRTEGGSSQVLLRSITEFDLLVDAADAVGNSALNYDSDELSIESVTMQKSNGSGPSSTFNITNITFKARNS